MSHRSIPATLLFLDCKLSAFGLDQHINPAMNQRAWAKHYRFFKEKTLFAVAAAIYHHLAAVKSPTLRQGGEEHRIICITQAQKVADRFRYMSDTDVAEDLSNTRKRFAFLTSWQERRL